MNRKISKVLDELEKKSQYELKNFHKIDHSKRMLAITKDTGVFYNTLLRATKPKKILEIGTSSGYSTLWFADAIMGQKSRIITIEENSNKIKIATKNFQKAGVSKIIQIKQGNAKQVLNEMLNEFKKAKTKKYFDFVFIDADKEQYLFYFEVTLQMLKKDGIIAADNIIHPERFQKHIKKYLAHVRKKPDVQTVIIPIGNGQQMSIKTK
jgi:predicted O-methyltransferase YrrM